MKTLDYLTVSTTWNFRLVEMLYNETMDWIKKLDHLMLALIVGIASVGVSFIGDMSRNVQQMAASIQELNVRMSDVSDRIRDHEERIRDVEKQRRR